MTKKVYIGLALVSALALSQPAAAGVITFDPFPSIPADVTVQYFSGGLTGPLATLPTPLAVALQSTNSAIPGGNQALLTYNADEAPFGPYGVLLTFDSLVEMVSAVGNDFGGDPTDDNEVVHLTAFGTLGTLIGSSTFSSPWAQPNLKNVSFLGSGIKYAALTWQNDLGYYSFDNIEYSSEAVPEPATLGLLGLGLFSLGMRSRRRNSR